MCVCVCVCACVLARVRASARECVSVCMYKRSEFMELYMYVSTMFVCMPVIGPVYLYVGHEFPPVMLQFVSRDKLCYTTVN